MSLLAMMKKPSALLPVLMSLAAMATVIVQLATHGVAPEADEGAAAHIFQILIVVQVPVIVFFAARWIPRASRAALQVLGLQVCAIIAALAPVYLLHW